MSGIPASARRFAFAAGTRGRWRVARCDCIVGEPLAHAPRLDVGEGGADIGGGDPAWTLRGIVSNERYVVRDEKAALVARQQGLGRPEARHAALIPIRKSTAWWVLAQDERREIFEAQSHHIAIGLRYLPAIARRLHHCRDLGANEPFDFITWFEYAPSESGAFDELVQALRASPEWSFVDRESDIRLVRDDA